MAAPKRRHKYSRHHTHPPGHHYRREGNERLVEINALSFDRVFSDLDPSPFVDRDLDPEVEEYILGAVQEIGRGEDIKIAFHLPEKVSEEDRQLLTDAVHHFFEYREWVTAQQLRQLFRQGLASLLIGLSFLFVCLAARELLPKDEGTTTTILSEGLLIMGWVAMWKPLEIVLYDWWPVRRQRRLFRQLTQVPVACAVGIDTDK